jgi:hypothetical protein
MTGRVCQPAVRGVSTGNADGIRCRHPGWPGRRVPAGSRGGGPAPPLGGIVFHCREPRITRAQDRLHRLWALCVLGRLRLGGARAGVRAVVLVTAAQAAGASGRRAVAAGPASLVGRSGQPPASARVARPAPSFPAPLCCAGAGACRWWMVDEADLCPKLGGELRARAHDCRSEGFQGRGITPCDADLPRRSVCAISPIRKHQESAANLTQRCVCAGYHIRRGGHPHK